MIRSSGRGRFLRPLAALAAICAGLPVTAAAASCSGKPPAGELRAERIAAVQPSRSGPSLYEGPVWRGDALYFSDFDTRPPFHSRIRRLGPDGKVSTALDDAGSNGLALDRHGDLLAATHKYKGLSRYDLASGKRTPVAERFQGNVFNTSNDLAVAADGVIYFTDPDYQKAAAPGGQPVTGIYRVGTDGAVTLVDGTRHNPNGIVLSRDGATLYANASDGLVRAYPIRAGKPQAGIDLIAGIEGGDGMTLDCHGNLYVTEHAAQRVRVFTPQGRELAAIRVDANVTNVAFGGADGRTLYITGAGALWQLRLDVSGRPG